MVKVKYLGKQPILVGHKFIYQDEVHSVTAAQLAALQARHGAALFQTDAPAVAKANPEQGLVTLYAAELRVHELLAPDETLAGAPANLNNQTEKKPRKRAKAG